MDRELNLAAGKPEHRRGQALVEAAMVLPLLLLLLVGIMEIGRAWNIRQVVTHAAREGARAAAVWHDSGEGKDSAEAAVLRSLQAASIAVVGSDSINVLGDQPDDEQSEVTVDLNYQFFLIGPVMKMVVPGQGNGAFGVTSIRLRSKAVMRNE
jgi:Flp pilus assembly protein TadG